jgi:hypothetical protein
MKEKRNDACLERYEGTVGIISRPPVAASRRKNSNMLASLDIPWRPRESLIYSPSPNMIT